MVEQLSRIYLDNSATSWPKPESVYQAVNGYMRLLGAAAGRGGYADAIAANQLVDSARHRVAQLIHAPSDKQIVFTLNGTDALNMALHGVLRAGDHVVTTVTEHNSVLRPLSHLREHLPIEVGMAACDPQGVVEVDAVADQIRSHTRLIAMTHVSNVTGAVQPVADVARLARDHGVLLLLDVAQSIGHIPIDLQSLPIDLLACSGHKGLLGPLGTGLLYIRPGLESELLPYRQGGTGTQSETDRQPESMPDRFESGNLNVAGIAGLRAGVEFVLENGVEKLAAHERNLAGNLREGLGRLPLVKVYGPRHRDEATGVVSFSVQGFDPHDVAAVLDATAGIQVRSGLHCAPRMHAALSTLAQGGTVRASMGPFSQASDVETLVATVRQLQS